MPVRADNPELLVGAHTVFLGPRIVQTPRIHNLRDPVRGDERVIEPHRCRQQKNCARFDPLLINERERGRAFATGRDSHRHHIGGPHYLFNVRCGTHRTDVRKVLLDEGAVAVNIRLVDAVDHNLLDAWALRHHRLRDGTANHARADDAERPRILPRQMLGRDARDRAGAVRGDEVRGHVRERRPGICIVERQRMD